jgi:hypothetical protein
MYREHAHYLRGLPRGVSPVRLPRSAAGTPNVINVPMLTINFADDLINPLELLNLPTARSHDTRAACCLGFGSSVFSGARTLTASRSSVSYSGAGDARHARRSRVAGPNNVIATFS